MEVEMSDGIQRFLGRIVLAVKGFFVVLWFLFDLVKKTRSSVCLPQLCPDIVLKLKLFIICTSESVGNWL